MRVLFGLVLGVLVTIGGAWLHDTSATTGASAERPMVNWDVVGRNFDQLTARLRGEWRRIAG